MTVMKWMFWIVPIFELVARAHGQQTVQIQVQPQVVGHSIRDGQVTTVFLAPRYVTAIRMPDPRSPPEAMVYVSHSAPRLRECVSWS